jgi:hypothetical protein
MVLIRVTQFLWAQTRSISPSIKLIDQRHIFQIGNITTDAAGNTTGDFGSAAAPHEQTTQVWNSSPPSTCSRRTTESTCSATGGQFGFWVTPGSYSPGPTHKASTTPATGIHAAKRKIMSIVASTEIGCRNITLGFGCAWCMARCYDGACNSSPDKNTCPQKARPPIWKPNPSNHRTRRMAKIVHSIDIVLSRRGAGSLFESTRNVRVAGGLD